MNSWIVEKANARTDKSHTFNCKGDKLKRVWKLTIRETAETLPDKAQMITNEDREVTASFRKERSDNTKRRRE